MHRPSPVLVYISLLRVASHSFSPCNNNPHIARCLMLASAALCRDNNNNNNNNYYYYYYYYYK